MASHLGVLFTTKSHSGKSEERELEALFASKKIKTIKTRKNIIWNIKEALIMKQQGKVSQNQFKEG